MPQLTFCCYDRILADGLFKIIPSSVYAISKYFAENVLGDK